MTTLPARIVHIAIARHWADVYAFVSKPEKMPLWPSGLASGLKPDGQDWIADGGPIGQVRVRFTPSNGLGVIDHTVTMENGQVVENALRVVPNGDGAEVMFTLLRRPDMDDAAFETDTHHVEQDLQTLKALLESRSVTTKGADRTVDDIDVVVEQDQYRSV
ncbi:SRPBCC family protein [Asticcacaulis sp.]|uniref:SRPBCC family protein n=1 Tax=Asticcacaulis sp. TaxID=1872648 RepID=UPI002C712CA2|nr:SRPBCC family protein [Asticcacaulis sp.]HTM81610.1 SRPBCC family protein [Asticcacaulis sp.]